MKRPKDKSPANGDLDQAYHIPVLLHQCLEGLAIKADGIYVDATFGGGGHAKAILQQLSPNGKLFAFDQDADALKNARDDKRLIPIHANFRQMQRFLRLHEAIPVDGILADLGVSSWQFDTAERGFSFRFNGPLDMRMNRNTEKTAATVLNEYSAERLQHMFSVYAEVRNAKTLAKAIVDTRQKKPLQTIA